MVVAVAGLVTASAPTDIEANAALQLKMVMNGIQFIKNVAFQDKLWLPILKEKVKMEYSKSRRHLDHYEGPVTSLATPVTVDPFKEVMNMMLRKSEVGTEVTFVVDAVKRSLVCSILKRVSMQGFLLHHLINRDNKADVLPFVIRWLEHMLRVSVNKLAAIDHSLPAVTKMLRHVRDALLANNPNYGSLLLESISETMFNELTTYCAVDDGRAGRYKTLVAEFKKSITHEQLKQLDEQLIKEKMKGISEIHSIADILKYHGSLNIAEDVEPSDFEKLNTDELKKIMTVNRIKMNLVLLSLPMKALSDVQWANIFDLNAIIVKDDDDE